MKNISAKLIFVGLLLISFNLLYGAVQVVYADCPWSMVSYWKFEEGSGNIYYDYSGSNNAECFGECPAYTSEGSIDGGQIFSGNNTGLDVNVNESFNWGINENFSIEYWMKRSPINLTENEVVIGRSDSSTNLLWWSGLLSDGTGSFILRAKNGDGGESSQFLFSTVNLADGLWHHVVVIRDADNNQNILYVDGVKQAAKTIIYSAGFDSSSAKLNIGWLNKDEGYHFSGTVDEMAMYKKVLSDVEIVQHYNDGILGLRLGYCANDYTVNIMPLGDSITEGYFPGADQDLRVGYRQKLYLDLFNLNYNIDFVGSQTSGDNENIQPPFDTDHEGHGGWTAYEILNGNSEEPEGTLSDWLTIYSPDVILLHIGTNGFPTSTTDVENILNEIDLYSEDITVLLARIINQIGQDTTTFNNNIESIANARIIDGDKIIIVDQENALTYPDDMSDELHPTTDGYNKMANVWMETLVKILPLNPVYSAPTAGFAGTPLNGFMPLEVVFTDTSSGDIDSWVWDFGDGISSSEQNPSHEYVAPGDYTVSLTVTGPGGSDTETIRNFTTVSMPDPPDNGDDDDDDDDDDNIVNSDSGGGCFIGNLSK